MSLYHKINTLFMRDPETKHKKLLLGQYAEPAFEYLASNKWTFTEKVDGTNIRVQVHAYSPEVVANEGQTHGITFDGKTDEAQIPAKLVTRLQERFMVIEQRKKLGEMFPSGAVLYGEGYGAGIQKVGPKYKDHQDFVLFDVRVGNWWLERANVEDVATKLGLEVVPVLGEGTLLEMIDWVQEGFESRWATIGGERFKAEGIVARPATELCDRAGKRIITKLKHKDF